MSHLWLPGLSRKLYIIRMRGKLLKNVWPPPSLITGKGVLNCANAVISIQHHVYTEYLDNQDCKAVRIFTMDFSKTFDSVNHSLLSAKLKQLPLNPNIVNWYHSFLHERQQRVSSGNHVCTWQAVNKGNDSQGSVSGLYLFSVFLNDLNIFHNDVPVLFKYAHDSTIIAPQ